VDPGRARAIGVPGSGMMRGAQRRRLREENIVVGLGTASRAWGQGLRYRRHHRLGSGKMVAHKGLDSGQERR
jgi:hypothetical protein